MAVALKTCKVLYEAGKYDDESKNQVLSSQTWMRMLGHCLVIKQVLLIINHKKFDVDIASKSKVNLPTCNLKCVIVIFMTAVRFWYGRSANKQTSNTLVLVVMSQNTCADSFGDKF